MMSTTSTASRPRTTDVTGTRGKTANTARPTSASGGSRTPALAHAMHRARGLNDETADEFVGMYVNSSTLDDGDRGREAVRLVLQRGVDAGLITRPV